VPMSEWDPRRGRGGRKWRRLVKELCPPGSVCCICGGAKGPILFGLRHNHPLGPSLDHIVDLQFGGHPTDPRNLRPAHFGCNAGKRVKPGPRSTSPRPFPPVDLTDY
jgi:hypothetical protein